MITKKNKTQQGNTRTLRGFRILVSQVDRHSPWKGFIVTVLMLFLAGCTGLRKIENSDPLYTGYKMNIHEADNLFWKTGLMVDLKETIKPKPNEKFFWMRPSLIIYRWMGNPKKEKGIRNWIKKNLGQQPVLLSQVDLQKNVNVLENRFFNQGYFHSKVSFTIQQGSKTARVYFSISPGIINKINKIVYQPGCVTLDTLLENLISAGTIKPGQSFNLKKLKAEREIIESKMKDSGYYYFDKDYLLYEADTLDNRGFVDLKMKIKPTIPLPATRRFRIGDLSVFDDYLISKLGPDTAYLNGTRYLSSKHLFRPEIILGQLMIHKGSFYSKTDHYYSINHLMNLGIFKNVNISFDYDSANDRLNPVVLMTPANIKSITTEFSANANSTNYIGPGITIGWKNRNIFRGAEQLSVNLTGSYEVQVGSDTINTSLEGGLIFNLDIPRMIPFRFKINEQKYIPATSFKGGYNIYKRVELYTMNSFFFSYGFNWKRSQYFFHQFNLADISYNKLSNQTPLFQDYLEQNPTVKKSFEEQFILGTSYLFVFDKLLNRQGKIRNYLSGSIETSGNLASLILRAVNKEWPSKDNQYAIFGLPYSQYVKSMIEYREYFKINNNNYIATRGIIGAGIPYGNSTVIPYIRQFYSGGTNSVRAFVSRTIGPGSHYSSQQNLAVDQTGDIRLEYNFEFRHAVSKLFKTALFLDAGNVWLWNNDPERPGSDFQLDRFWKEFAIGWGLGLRVDFEVTVVRFDLSWPLYKPYLDEGQRWAGSDSFNSDYRKSGLLINFALGYPF